MRVIQRGRELVSLLLSDRLRASAQGWNILIRWFGCAGRGWDVLARRTGRWRPRHIAGGAFGALTRLPAAPRNRALRLPALRLLVLLVGPMLSNDQLPGRKVWLAVCGSSDCTWGAFIEPAAKLRTRCRRHRDIGVRLADPGERVVVECFHRGCHVDTEVVEYDPERHNPRTVRCLAHRESPR